jgi:hypothetical protein
MVCLVSELSFPMLYALCSMPLVLRLVPCALRLFFNLARPWIHTSKTDDLIAVIEVSGHTRVPGHLIQKG